MELHRLLRLAVVLAVTALALGSGASAAPAAQPSLKPVALSGYSTRAEAAAAAKVLAALKPHSRRALYLSWCKKYKKQSDDRRYRAWLTNLNNTIAWNLRPSPPVLRGLNSLSDYLPAELSRMVMRRSDPNRSRTRSAGAVAAAAAGERAARLPNKWNWVTQGKVSGVRDQALDSSSSSQCASSWAFAALGALESRARIGGTARLPNYSEQQMIDCVTGAAGYGSFGCAGGTAEDVYAFASAAYVAQETGYPPYTARKGSSCQAASTVGAVAVRSSPGYDIVPGNPDAIMRAVYETGPVVAYLYVLPPSNNASLFYYDAVSGNYPASVCTAANPNNEINHAVVIVGYNRAEKYWIVRNSWGIGWGSGGYARLEMTVGGFGTCAMYKYGVIAPRRLVKYVKPPAPQPPPASRKRAPLVDWWIIAADSSFRTWAGAGFEFSGGPPFNRLYTSRNAGYTWSTPVEAEMNAIWFSLSVAGNGKLFLAGKRNEYLYTSTDGTNWTARATSLGRLNWRATASSYDGARLAAAADGALYTSADGGVTWTKRSGAGARKWASVASSSDGMRLAAADSFGCCIYTSSDQGATWTERRPDSVDKFWLGVASSGDGLRLLAIPSGGLPGNQPSSKTSPCLFLSEDGGQSWKQVQCTGGWVAIAVSANGKRLFASNGGSILTSTDGTAWKPCGSLGVGNVFSLATSADGRHVLAASVDHALRLSDDVCASWVRL